MKWRNVPPYSIPFNVSSLQSTINARGGQIRFIYSNSTSSCSATFTLKGAASVPTPTAAPTFPPLPPDNAPPNPPALPSIAECTQNPLKQAYLRAALREAVGKQECPLYGYYYGAGGIEAQFGQYGHMLYIPMSSGAPVIFAGISTFINPFIVFTGEYAIGSSASCWNEEAFYAAYGHGSGCDIITLEVLVDNCTDRVNILNGLTLYAANNTVANYSCPYTVQQGTS